MKKIKFVQAKVKRRLKISRSWRKPKGIHNKVQKSRVGHVRKVKIGYGQSKQDKIEITIIKKVSDLDNAKGKLIIASTVGMRKKVEILKKAKEKKLIISNLKKADEYLTKVDNILKNKKEKQKETKQKKEKREKDSEKKKKPEDKKVEPEKSQEEEKKELDKILTKK